MRLDIPSDLLGVKAELDGDLCGSPAPSVAQASSHTSRGSTAAPSAHERARRSSDPRLSRWTSSRRLRAGSSDFRFAMAKRACVLWRSRIGVLVERRDYQSAMEGDPSARLFSARLGRAASLAGDAPRLPRLSSASQQGDARGDHLDRPRTPSTDDVRDRGPPVLKNQRPGRKRRPSWSRPGRPSADCRFAPRERPSDRAPASPSDTLALVHSASNAAER